MAKKSKHHSPFPVPPPPMNGMFFPPNRPGGLKIPDGVWQAVNMYVWSIDRLGKPYPGWESFERELALEFALLLSFLKVLPRADARRDLLEWFLDALHLENKPGRARKARVLLKGFSHGLHMETLWNSELQPAWAMKESLESADTNPESRLGKSFHADVVREILSHKATPESSLAKIYAQRNHLSAGTARNALREFRKFRATGKLAVHF
jgi:hypothetical protein